MAIEKNQLQEKPPTEQVSNFNLKLSYWYINNKQRLRLALIIFLILVSVGFYAYTLYRAVTIVFIDSRNVKSNLDQLSSNAIDYSYFKRANQPKDIQILSFNATAGAGGRYDFVAKLANPNENFAAIKVDLSLVSGSTVVDQKSTFILPGEQKLVVFFGEELSRSANPNLKVVKTAWARQRSYPTFAEPRLQFVTSDIAFNPAGRSADGSQLPASILSFKLTNNSAFGFWQVGVYAALVSGDQIVAANYIALDQFASGETRGVEMRWSENLPPISDYIILPEVNILDEAVYMSVK